MNIFQGEVVRIRKRMGILTSKTPVYLCINQDRINMYNLPLTAVPVRQFLFDHEKISCEIDKSDKSVLRLKVNKKEYVLKVEDETQAKDWRDFIQRTVEKSEPAAEESKTKGKIWREPHVTKKRFNKEANTFDLIQFVEGKVKTLGVILQIIDHDANYNLLFTKSPDVLYYSPSLGKVLIRPYEEIASTSNAFVVPLFNYECTEDNLEVAQNLIVNIVSFIKIIFH